MPHSENRTAKEMRLRRYARQQDLKLHKNGVRNPRAILYDTYMLADLNGQRVAWGHPKGYGLSLDEIEEALNEEDTPCVEQPFVKTWPRMTTLDRAS